jgi:hypothetical protein
MEKIMAMITDSIPIGFSVDYSNWVMEAARHYQINPSLLTALYVSESDFRYNAKSPKRYRGIAQTRHYLPPRESIFEEARILKEKLELCHNEKKAISLYKGFGGQINGRAKSHIDKVMKIKQIVEGR